MEMNVAWMLGLMMTAYEYATDAMDRELERLYHACHNPHGGYWSRTCFLHHEVYGGDCVHSAEADSIWFHHNETWHSDQVDHHVATFRFYESNRTPVVPEPEPVAVIDDDEDIPF